MARIWPVYEGKEPTLGGPWAELSLPDAISLLGLRPEDFVSELETRPRFGDQSYDLQHRGFKHIVVEVDPVEAKREKWQPGFYKPQVTPDETFGKLLQLSIASELGKQDVLRVIYEPTTDSSGEPALRITAVITQDGVKKLASAKPLNALVKLRQQLRLMREPRTPIVEYATEEELAQDASS